MNHKQLASEKHSTLLCSSASSRGAHNNTDTSLVAKPKAVKYTSLQHRAVNY
jgi:hypothetical protein